MDLPIFKYLFHHSADKRINSKIAIANNPRSINLDPTSE